MQISSRMSNKLVGTRKPVRWEGSHIHTMEISFRALTIDYNHWPCMFLWYVIISSWTQFCGRLPIILQCWSLHVHLDTFTIVMYFGFPICSVCYILTFLFSRWPCHAFMVRHSRDTCNSSKFCYNFSISQHLLPLSLLSDICLCSSLVIGFCVLWLRYRWPHVKGRSYIIMFI